MNTVVTATEPLARNLRGIPLLKATRTLLRHPSQMAKRTGLAKAVYNQANPGMYRHDCGSIACVAGWIVFLSGRWDGISPLRYRWWEIADLTGMSSDQASALYFHDWDRWGIRRTSKKRSNAAAVRVLDRIIEELEAEAAA